MDKSVAAISTDFFSNAEKQKILAAVADAESRSSGEIAIMVVPESDRYLEAEQLGALLLAGLVAVIICVLTHHVTIWTYIPLVCLLFLPALTLFRRFPRLKISFAGPRRQAEAVRARALIGFYENGLYRTEGETGILIFISLLEHKVWILGDRGINEKIPPGYWQTLAGELAAGIRSGRAAETLCRVVAECGSELAHHFPRSHDDRNELANEILTS
ncbi:MAG: hypothetical protein A2075_11180 [Geobacteraceae bacterium GWC2_58_44]|nr:MAG: hypothetical protein A2075_11180 [Geobacteraceae bacterium GWC2_58_44]HBG05696.1 hypothetical protein [Geobacter sp.]